MSELLFPPPPPLVSLLHRGRQFWLATHVYPDHDGFGSMLAMGRALKIMGREVSMVYEGDGPAQFAQLPGFDDTVASDQLEGRPDALILFDCHELLRIPPAVAGLAANLPLVIVDHHVSDDATTDPLHWIVRESPATSCLVHSLIRALGVELDAAMADCMYAALLTDTGGFRFPNTTPAALRCAADLVQAGANASELADRLLHRRRPQALRLLGDLFTSAEYFLDDQAVIVTIDAARMAKAEAKLEEVEGVSGFFTSAVGVRLVAILKDDGDQWRVSLRAVGGLDVQAIAKALGGGGHRVAAGFESTAPVEALKRTILEHFTRTLAAEAS